jgi:integrase
MPTVAEPEISPLTQEQLSAVLALIREHKPDLAPVVTWIALTGNRPSDAVSLTWVQVNLKTGSVSRAQVKTKQLANYELSGAALECLKTERNRPWYDGKGTVFRDAYGSTWSVNRVYKDFTRTLARIGFERTVTLKDLRHTFGSLMANEMGCPLPILRRLMGHSMIETTMKYIRGGDARPVLDRFALGITENPDAPRHIREKGRK